jgi:DNA polymerase I
LANSWIGQSAPLQARPTGGERRAEIWGIKEVCERWGIQRVDQVIDMLGLMGDCGGQHPRPAGYRGKNSRPNYSPSTDSVENLIANADKLKGKQQEIVQTHARKSHALQVARYH